MKPVLAMVGVGIFLATHPLFAASATAPAPVPVATDEPATGAELAAMLSTLQPPRNSEFSGALKIRLGAKRREVSVVVRVEIGTNEWRAVYDVDSTGETPAEKFVVIHRPGLANEYRLARAARPGIPAGEPRVINAAEAAVALGGSDFWLSELGLDFLHWPQQQKLKGEMRLGQPCYVLESVNPSAAGGVARIKTWIEKEGGNVLVAEAFDEKRQLIKEYSLSGSSFKKVNGQYQLEEMKIRNARTGSQTTLRFNLPPD